MLYTLNALITKVLHFHMFIIAAIKHLTQWLQTSEDHLSAEASRPSYMIPGFLISFACKTVFFAPIPEQRVTRNPASVKSRLT